MDTSTVRWGVLGPGSIARKFAAGLGHADGAKLHAAGSRSLERAREFAGEFGCDRAYGSYEELIRDPDVDVVYVATPHTQHAEHARLCIEHGKPALVEKPFAVNEAQAREVADLARERGVFCMEGMWTWFFPAIQRVRELVESGAIGRVRLVQADFGFRSGINPEHRLFNPALAGGSLLDVGIYPISLACFLLGEPSAVTGQAQIGETGVDEVAAMLLSFPNEAFALLSSAIRLNTQHEAVVSGEDGSIRLGDGWWKASSFIVRRAGEADEVVEMPYPGSGFQFEAAHVQACLREGRRESEIVPLDNTLMRMRVMDELRRQWGLKYPGE